MKTREEEIAELKERLLESMSNEVEDLFDRAGEAESLSELEILVRNKKNRLGTMMIEKAVQCNIDKKKQN